MATYLNRSYRGELMLNLTKTVKPEKYSTKICELLETQYMYHHPII